ncbi:MAG TPA: FMN-binding protein [Methanocellales archaeon]|nr:FMN-binding protein [Methanocellales archaeon]
MVKEELKYVALLLGIIGALFVLILILPMVTVTTILGVGLVVLILEILPFSYIIYKEHKGEPLVNAIGTVARLTLIAMVAAGALSTTYETTQAYMAANLEMVLPRIMPDAATFTPVGGEEEPVYYEAYDDAGNLVGYVFFVEKQGSQGLILLAGAIDLDYNVLVITVVRHSETAGLGAKIKETAFRDQFLGLSVADLHLSPEGKIDAITGATISSQAVVDAMRTKIGEIQTEVA